MTLRQIGAVVVCAFALTVSAAEAKQRHKQARHDFQAAVQCAPNNSGHFDCGQTPARVTRHAIPGRAVAIRDGRPSRWCGWWMRQQLGVANVAGNMARWWAGYGTNAHGPAVGALVVWRHHVGIITAQTAAGWMVKSGNDGGAVRERVRSLKGAIAFRWPNRVASR